MSKGDQDVKPQLEPPDCVEMTCDDDGVAVLTLARPERLNAMSPRMIRELRSAFAAINDDDAVRAVVVTGQGRGFCAGMDLAGGTETFADGGSEKPRGQRPGRTTPREDSFDISGPLALDVFRSSKPVVGAVNGVAVGVGATFTLPMDLRLASEKARFRFPFTRLGISPDACSSWFLPRVVGISTALRWALSGADVSAGEALNAGLVESVHAPEDLLAAAREAALGLVRNTSAVSVAVTRRLFWEMLTAPDPDVAHRLESRALFSRGRSADAKEGVRSLVQKRAPSFPDRVSADLPEWFRAGPLVPARESGPSDACNHDD